MILKMDLNQSGEEEEIPTILTDVDKKLPSRMMSVDDSIMLPEHYHPTDDDVICSWARQNHSHPGNERFRMLIEKYAPIYDGLSTKYQKSGIIAKIVNEVRTKSRGAGFVRKDFYSGRWFDIGDEKARDKVGHAIRKAAAFLDKKQPGATTKPTKKVRQSSKQKLKMEKKQQRAVLDSTTTTDASQRGIVDQTPAVLLHDSSTVNRDIAQDINLRAHRAMASLLTPSLDPSVFSSTTTTSSSFAASNMASFPSLSFFPGLASVLGTGAPVGLGLDNITTSDSDRLLQTIQARQFLSNAAQQQLQQQLQQQQIQQQQEQAMNVLRQSNEISLLTRNERESNFGMYPQSIIPRLRLVDSSLHGAGSPMIFPSAAAAGGGGVFGGLELSNSLLLQQALQQQRVTGESLLMAPSAGLQTDTVHTSGTSSAERTSRDQDRRSTSQDG